MLRETGAWIIIAGDDLEFIFEDDEVAACAHDTNRLMESQTGQPDSRIPLSLL